jgi:hypothetical protein
MISFGLYLRTTNAPRSIGTRAASRRRNFVQRLSERAAGYVGFEKESVGMKRKILRRVVSVAVTGVGLTGLGLSSSYAHEEDPPPSAPGSTWEPEQCNDHASCGHVSGLIPMPYNAVGASTVWSRDNWENPKIHFKGRHSEFKPTDVYDIACVEAAILSSHYPSWPIPREEWEHHFPSSTIDPLDIFRDGDTVERFDTTGNSHLRKGLSPCIRSSFKSLVYGGYTMHQGQSLFVASRTRAYMDRENAQVWDTGHPDAFAVRVHEDGHAHGVLDNVFIDEEDALLNLASFQNSGASRGLNYSIYSLGYATLPDGRVVNVGGHNMHSNSGFRKLNIYNPETNSWAPRPEPCNIANWRRDPGGVELGYKAYADAVALAGGQPGSFGGVTDYVPAGDQLVNGPEGHPTWPNCDQRNREDVDPPHSSDMRYQRWYPSAFTLPNGMAIVYGGDDLDESVGSDPDDPSTQTRDNAFRATRIHVPVADLYNPATDTTVALENARRVYPLYPQAVIVETGPRDEDWALCTFGGEPAPASEASLPRSDATNDAAEWRNFCAEPGCAEDTRAIRLITQGSRPAASLDCLDVQAAAADPNVNIPAENHYTHVDTAKNAYGYCCGEADIVKLGPNGQTLSHKYMVINGTIALGEVGAGTRTNEIEMIELTDPEPQWAVVANTYQPGSNVHMLPLPDGTVFIRGGVGPGGGTYELRQYTKLQQFFPDTRTIRTLAKSTHLGGLHKTLSLLPTGEPIIMGGDRSVMVQNGDRTFTPGDADLGVSVAQIFSPPYLFSGPGDEDLATRPVMTGAPDFVDYKQRLKVRVRGSRIQTVSMFRTGSVTHELHNDYRLVILNFKQRGSNLEIDMPYKPAQAVAGDYMLFVVDEHGTPSMSKHIRLKLPTPPRPRDRR